MGSLLLLVLLLDVLPSELILQDLVALEFGVAVGVGEEPQVLHLHLPLRTRESLQEVLRQLHFLERLNGCNFCGRYIAFLEVRESWVMSSKNSEQP